MGNNLSDAAAVCKPCCEEEMLQDDTVKVRPVGFDQNWREEVCDLESRNSSWDFASLASSLPKAQGSATTSDSRAENARHQEQDLSHLEFILQQGDPFGLQLTETRDEPQGSSRLVVVQVESRSPFARTVYGVPGVAAGDTIVEVNGQRGTAFDLREALQQVVASGGERTISLSVSSRPPSFDVALIREGTFWQKLGVAVAIDKTKRDCLIVQNVRNEGLVPQWNAENGTLRVCIGDLVTHVNGITGDARAMCAAITAATEGSKLNFRVATPAQSSPRDSRQLERLSQLSRVSLGSSAFDTSLCKDDEKAKPDEASDKAKPDEASDVSTASTECGGGTDSDYARTTSPEATEWAQAPVP